MRSAVARSAKADESHPLRQPSSTENTEEIERVTFHVLIHVVERLAATSDDRTKSWLLHEGCRNDIRRPETAHHLSAGWMFWFPRKKFVGSYFCLSAASRW